jgi:hypothetical protein
MNQKGFFVSKPLFIITVGIAFLLLLTTGVLIKDRTVLREHARQLIIQNDSIISVNIALSDSLSGNPSDADTKRSAVSKSNWKK